MVCPRLMEPIRYAGEVSPSAHLILTILIEEQTWQKKNA